MGSGSLTGLEAADVSGVFDAMLKSPAQQIGFMVLAVLLGFLVCRLGLKNGVERVSKVMMSCLFLIMIVLCVRSLTLPNAIEGLKFYLIPDFNRMLEAGISNVIFAAMSQASSRCRSAWDHWRSSAVTSVKNAACSVRA